MNVRDKPAFLRRMMYEFIGGWMSLEGDLSKCKFAEQWVVSREETGLLKRNTLWPRQGFVILRLEKEAIEDVFRQVMAAGLSRAIVHVQIEHDGILQLGAYDNFHPESVVAGPGVGELLLAELKSNEVLRDFGA